MTLLDKETLLKEIEEIIPDWHMYYVYYIDEWTAEDMILELEWEVWLRENWESEGYESKEKVNYIKKDNIRRINGLLTRYYNSYNNSRKDKKE